MRPTLPEHDGPEVKEATGEIRERTPKTDVPPRTSEPSILVADPAAAHRHSAVVDKPPVTPPPADAASPAAEAEVAAVRRYAVAFEDAEHEASNRAESGRNSPKFESFDDLDEGYQPVGFWDCVFGPRSRRSCSVSLRRDPRRAPIPPRVPLMRRRRTFTLGPSSGVVRGNRAMYGVAKSPSAGKSARTVNDGRLSFTIPSGSISLPCSSTRTTRQTLFLPRSRSSCTIPGRHHELDSSQWLAISALACAKTWSRAGPVSMRYSASRAAWAARQSGDLNVAASSRTS